MENRRTIPTPMTESSQQMNQRKTFTEKRKNY